MEELRAFRLAALLAQWPFGPAACPAVPARRFPPLSKHAPAATDLWHCRAAASTSSTYAKYASGAAALPFAP
jgi:hypothetical protein